MTQQNESNGITELAAAVGGYLTEVRSYLAIAARHELTAAIHTRGPSLQVYRQFPRDSEIAASIRSTVAALPWWEDSPYWSSDGKGWASLQQQVETRMKRHNRQHPVLTRGIVWDGRPLLVHAYKFEPDTRLKLEIIVPKIRLDLPELPLRTIATALLCHEFLVPAHVGTPLAPYDAHETEFLTISEYLKKTTPKHLYAARCIPGVLVD